MNKTNKGRLSKSETIKPGNFIERFCNKLTIKEEDTKKQQKEKKTLETC